jgi:7-cyano-7-deazaguanine synthase
MKKIVKALVLLSGGQDSATCLAVALKNYPGQVAAIAFDYGQRHRVELDMAKKLAKKRCVDLKLINISAISQLSTNALTSESVDIEFKPGELPSTFVPGRNLIFISYAAIYARSLGVQDIYTGVCQADFSGYPDCRDSFIKSLNQTLNLAMDYSFNIITPLMNISKADSVRLMKDIGCLGWYKHTHTCYEGQRPACGRCPSCLLRLKGFNEAGLLDPIAYI